MALINSADNSCFLTGRVKKLLAGAVKIQGGELRRLRHVGRLEIFLEPAWRGKGIGRALMVAAVRWAEENPRLKKLALAVYDDNVRAVQLYQTLGFQIEGRRENEYREGDGTLRSDLLMARPV